MRTIIILLIGSILFTSCVSSKKYSELQNKVEQLEATEKAYSQLSQNPPPRPPDQEEDPEVADLRQQLNEAHKEMNEMKREAAYNGMSEMSEEDRLRMHEERQRAMELEMMKMHEENTIKKSDEAFGVAENHFNFAVRAAEGALSKYDAPNVLVERAGSQLVITVMDEILFSTDRKSISASGETFVNRMQPVFEISKDMNISIYGISENDGNLSGAFDRALALNEGLKKLPDYKVNPASIGTLACKNAKSGRKSNCDKVEIVIQANFEEALELKRNGQ